MTTPDTHNAKHSAFFLTLSLEKNVDQRLYDELKAYLKAYGIYYGIKTEQGDSGKLHIHAIHIGLPAQKDTADDPRVQFRRCGADHINYILRRCPIITKAIALHGSKHSFQSLPLTSTRWITYLNKESPMHVNNFPDDMTLLTQYLSEVKGPRVADPQLDADSKDYERFAKENKKPNPPTHWIYCKGYYLDCYFKSKTKKSVKDDNTVKKYAISLYRYITGDIDLACGLQEPKRPTFEQNCKTMGFTAALNADLFG